MKFILLAATAMIATPVMAQDMSTQTPPAGQTTPAPTDPTAPAPTDQTTTPADPATTTTTPAPADQTMTGGTMAPAQSTDTATAAAGDPNATDPAGGYQPSQPATTGAAAPGATVRFQPAPDPNTAYPPPAPLAKYPVCKKGQYDNCMQRGGR